MQAAVTAQAAANLGQAQANNLSAVMGSAQISAANNRANNQLFMSLIPELD